jgi:RNA polymerase primary sigma factor
VRIPVQVVEAQTRLNAAQQRLTQELQRAPSMEELAEQLGLNPQRVGELLRAMATTVSLDGPVGAGEETSLADLLANRDTVPLDERVQERLLGEEAARTLDRALTAREKLVLEMRFGLGERDVYPLESIGRRLGLTRERVRQIEQQALEKLRRPDVSAELRRVAA